MLNCIQHDPSGRSSNYATRYFYDEAGNRIRKLTYFINSANPGPILNWRNLSNPGNGWALNNNEYYVRGVDGKELATYNGNTHIEWYVWASDMVGKIKNGKPYYYFKDHLGSTRVIINSSGAITAGYDYDAWGYLLENRSFNSDTIKFKFTGKETDKENLYDYFGARYYSARIGRWVSIDPLLEKHYDFSPYNYVLINPLFYIDPKGNQEQATFGMSVTEFILKNPYVIPLIPSTVAQGGTILLFGGIIVLITPNQLGTLDVNPSIFTPGLEGYYEFPHPISEIEVVYDPNVYRGGKKQVWPDQYIGGKPKEIKDIDWSKGDQELADQITGKDAPRGPKTPNNEIKKWFRDHRPKNRNPIIEHKHDEEEESK